MPCPCGVYLIFDPRDRKMQTQQERSLVTSPFMGIFPIELNKRRLISDFVSVLSLGSFLKASTPNRHWPIYARSPCSYLSEVWGFRNPMAK